MEVEGAPFGFVLCFDLRLLQNSDCTKNRHKLTLCNFVMCNVSFRSKFLFGNCDLPDGVVTAAMVQPGRYYFTADWCKHQNKYNYDCLKATRKSMMQHKQFTVRDAAQVAFFLSSKVNGFLCLLVFAHVNALVS